MATRYRDVPWPEAAPADPGELPAPRIARAVLVVTLCGLAALYPLFVAEDDLGVRGGYGTPVVVLTMADMDWLGGMLPYRGDAAVLVPCVREAVTNILKHSGASYCTLRLTADGTGRLRLLICNDGGDKADSAPLAAAGRAGNGLRNLAARLEAAGGHLTATREDGTFSLAAELPLARRPARPPPLRTPAARRPAGSPPGARTA